MINFKDKKILITGASGGIGTELVKKFTSLGGNVIGSGTKAEKLDLLKKKYPNIKVKKFDIGDHSRIEEFIDDISLELGGLDILINNAGITKDNLLLRMDEDSWKKVIDINLNSCFNLTKCAIREFMKKKEGVIINISSIVGIKGNAGQSNYSASKAGINGFTKSIALELGSRNIRCNAIAPGFIETDMTSKGDGKLLESWVESIPLKRAGHVEDIANLCVYLASEKGSYITGQIIKVDGGLVT